MKNDFRRAAAGCAACALVSAAAFAQPLRVVMTGTVTSLDNDFEATMPNTRFALGSPVAYTVVIEDTPVLPRAGLTTRYVGSIVSWSVEFGAYRVGGVTGDIFVREQGNNDQFAIAHNDRRANIQFFGRDRDDFNTGGDPIAGVPFTLFDFGTETTGVDFISPTDDPLAVFTTIAQNQPILDAAVMRLLLDNALLDGVVEVFGIASVDSITTAVLPAPCNPADIAEPFGELTPADLERVLLLVDQRLDTGDANADTETDAFDLAIRFNQFADDCAPL